jgi:hypothetical protein
MTSYAHNVSVELPELPVVIEWKGKIGYGDIVSPISYAHNIADKNSTDVRLNFHWDYSKPTRFKESDQETIHDWIPEIANEITPAKFFNVEINHIFNSKLNFNHTNYVEGSNMFHNMRFAKNGSSDYNYSRKNNKTIVLVTSLENKEQFKDYDRSKLWKDPIGDTPDGNAWRKVGDLIRKRGYNVVHVHYSTPIDTAIGIFKRCRGVIGYHGSLMWLARMYGCPMVIFSKGKLTKQAFPWARVYKYWNDFEIRNIEEEFQSSISRREQLIEEYEKYLTIPNLHRLRGERT